MIEIKRIEARRTSFMLATTFFVMQAMWLVILALVALFGSAEWGTVVVVVVWSPVVTIAMGATTYLFAVTYNLLAPRIGGMVIELDERPQRV